MSDEASAEAVVYDACVLYPYTLRDTLISLTKTGKFQARWTEAINEEGTRNLLKDNPNISAERLNRTCRLMNRAIPDAIIDGYEPLIDHLILPDPSARSKCSGCDWSIRL